MTLTPTAIQEFRDLWLKNYSQELTDDDALEKATNLLTLFKAIYKPIPGNQHDN